MYFDPNTPKDFLPPNTTIVGLCSICGGKVTVPSMWMSVIPPVPTCSKCGATQRAQADNYPIIDMDPYFPQNYKTTWTTNTY